MYDALDSFLRIDTWHTGHPLDDRRFFTALDQIVRDPEFYAEDLRSYVHGRVNNPAMDHAVDRLTSAAWAVREFLEATGEVPGRSGT